MHFSSIQWPKEWKFCKGQCKLFVNSFLDIKLMEKQIRAGNNGVIAEPLYTIAIQNPGDFLVLKPNTYHFGFNLGYNINEGKIKFK